MKIYLEARFGGGSGGEEKLLDNILKTKPNNIEIDLNIIINNKLNLDNYDKNITLVNCANKNYDCGIKLGLIGDSRDYIHGNFKKKILNPCEYHILDNGKYNKQIYEYYDIIWKETPQSNQGLKKEIVICPPIFFQYKKLENNSILEQFKDKKYYVTVANYYDINMKGIDLLYEFAKISKYPIIWFNSDTKTYCDFPKFEKPKNLKIARNIDHNTILDTVANSEAYICFSRTESFGFSLVEAINLKKPIVTKKVGVVNYYPDKFNIFETLEEINSLVFKKINYNEYDSLFKEDFWSKITDESF